MPEPILLDAIWVLIASILVFFMQPGFVCMETSLSNSKTPLNTATQNLVVLSVSLLGFWLCGHAFMNGHSYAGLIGVPCSLLSFPLSLPDSTVFIYQALTCATGAVIIIGALAERLKLPAAMFLAILYSCFLYPVFGHWAWNTTGPFSQGCLLKEGFIDLAGSTALHSISGWTAFAALLIIGPRQKRFTREISRFRFSSANMPLAVVGTTFLCIGWIGLNAGRTLALTESVPQIIFCCFLSGAAGGITSLLTGLFVVQPPRAPLVIQGLLGGLVAISAGCGVIHPQYAPLVGGAAGILCILTDQLLLRFRIDDAIGAIPVHLACGIWGTIAVALFVPATLSGSGLSLSAQLFIQIKGIFAAFLLAFILPYLLLFLTNKIFPLRVSAETEEAHLRSSAIWTTWKLTELRNAMDALKNSGDLSQRLPALSQPDIRAIADHHNSLLDALEESQAYAASLRDLSRDGIITFTGDTLEITDINQTGRAIFGFGETTEQQIKLRNLFEDSSYRKIRKDLSRECAVEAIGKRLSGSFFPMQATIRSTKLNGENYCIGAFRDITELKNQEKILRQSELRYRELFENIDVAIIVLNPNMSLHAVNHAVEELSGYSGKELLRMDILNLVPGEAREKVLQYHNLRRTRTDHFPISFELQLLHKNGQRIPVFVNVAILSEADKTIVTIVDLSKQHEAKALLNRQKAFFLQLFEGSSQAIAALDTNLNVIEVNRSFENLFGYETCEIYGRPLGRFIVPGSHKDEERSLQQAMRHGNLVHRETLRKHKDGTILQVDLIGFSVKLENNLEGFFYILDNITSRKTFENELHRQAFFDGLTNIPNRMLFMERLEKTFEKRQRQETYKYAVMLLDLDRFKQINDTLGHLCGDELLSSAARRFRSCIRSTDTIARLGGDEFAIIIDGFEVDTHVIDTATRLLKAAQLPFVVGNQEVHLSASLGIVLNTRMYSEPEAILRDADIAMYRAKDLGKARFQIFNKSLHEMVSKTAKLENDLREACTNEEFVLYYQPIISFKDKSLLGFEALIRWEHPALGFIPPEEFIPLTEENGLIWEIGSWVLIEACHQTQKWRECFPDFRNITVNVNLSPKQFLQKDIFIQVEEALKSTRLPPSSLRLEITESTIMEGGEQTISQLKGLQKTGISIAIDDFGTGYSSLSSLQSFPVDDLKIDKSFVKTMEESFGSREIIKTIISLGQTLQLKIVAEGVETEEQFESLKALHCDKAQGHLFSKALPADQAETLFSTFSPPQ